MDKKSLNVLLILQETGPMKAANLCAKLQVSEKTIRNIIRTLKEELPHQGAQLISSSKYGYELRIEDSYLYQSFITKEQQSFHNVLETSHQRIEYIMRYFLSHCDTYVKLDNLADHMHISKSCLQRDMKEVRKLLIQHNLSFVSKPGYGTKIEGKEYNLRICIADYTIHHEEHKLQYLDMYEAVLQKIMTCVSETLQACSYTINEFSYQNLLMHLFVAILRIQRGNAIGLPENQFLELQKLDEYTIAVQLVKRLEATFEMKIPYDEAGYITIHLAAKKNICGQEPQEQIVIEDKIQFLIKAILQHIYERYSLDLRNDLDLTMALSLHFVTLDIRLRYELNMYNPILKDIKNKYQLAFLITQSCNEIILQSYHKKLSDDELAYIALHIELAIERLQHGVEKKNVLIICSTGAGTSQLLKYEYQKRFHEYIGDIYVVEPSNLNDFDFQKVDYIFSTIEVSLKTNKPVLLIHPILETKDIETITSMINTTFTLQNFFSPSLFFPLVDGDNEKEVLADMVKKMKEVITLPENFYDLIMEREELGITNFETGVAFPHPNHPCVEHTFVAVGILKKRIVWNTSKVQMIYLFALTKHEKEKDIPLLYKVTGELLTDELRIKDIIEKQSYTCFEKHLREIEIIVGE